MPYDNNKSQKKTGFHPLFRRYFFEKPQGGVNLTPKPPQPRPVVLGLKLFDCLLLILYDFL